MVDPHAMSDNPYAPPESPTTAKAPTSLEGPSGLGGWLILLGLTLVSGVVVRIFGLVQNFQFLGGPDWRVVTTAGGPDYDPWWGLGIVIEIILFGLLLVFNLAVLLLFFTKRRLFPFVFLIFCLSNVLVSLIDSMICSLIHNFPTEARVSLNRSIVQSLIYTAIWGTYVMKSVRVRNTFVR